MIAERSRKLIEALVNEIKKTGGLVKEIAEASREQDVGAQQVSTALVQMDQVVQQNASASEELASMAEELAAQATILEDVIAFFKLDDQGQSATMKLIAAKSSTTKKESTSTKATSSSSSMNSARTESKPKPVLSTSIKTDVSDSAFDVS